MKLNKYEIYHLLNSVKPNLFIKMFPDKLCKQNSNKNEFIVVILLCTDI